MSPHIRAKFRKVTKNRNLAVTMMLECNLDLSVEMFLFTNVNKIMNTDTHTMAWRMV